MKAIFAGTFDPFTTGHRNIAERAVRLFGNLTIAVASDTGKNTVSLLDRAEIVRIATLDMRAVAIEPFSGLLSDYLAKNGDCVLVRGVRGMRDTEYERDLSRVYKSLCGKDTVFLMTGAEFEHVSSTVVRELVSLGGDINGYVMPQTAELLKKLYRK